MAPEEILVRDGARKILAEYDNPPEGGTLVPRAWVEENLLELRVVAEVEQRMLGDLNSWKPTGLLNALGIEPADRRL